jgi:hypothetical protein
VHLQLDHRCGIHDRLRGRGFPGCTVFDCFGAGQQVVQQTFGGRSWHESPELAADMFAVFPVMRQLHEGLWHLTEALALPAAGPLHDEVEALRSRTEELAAAGPAELLGLDVGDHRRQIGELLERVSALARSGSRARSRRGADLLGADLRRARLHGADLRGAYLIGADLRGVDLGPADLLGADLRAADVRGTDLRTCLFLTQPQIEAARGDSATKIPAVLRRPEPWRPRVPPSPGVP